MADLNVEWINPFIESTRSIIETVAAIKVELDKPLKIKKNNATGYDVSGIIGLTGKAVGSISLSFPKKTALKIVSDFTGEEVIGIDNDTIDAIGELTNMIAGRAKKIFAEKDIRMKISLPTVILGKGHTINTKKNIPGIEIPFKSEDGNFAILVSLKSNSEQA